MSELEDLRKRWRSISIDAPHTGAGAPESYRRIEKARNARQRMLRRYRMMLCIVVLGIANGVTLDILMGMPVWISIYYYLYMALAGVLNAVQMRKLTETDVIALPTVDAIEFIKRFSAMRNRVKIIMLAIGLPLIVLLICALEHENGQQIMFAGIAGAIIGGAIGLMIDRRFRTDLKAMRQFLGETQEEEEEAARSAHHRHHR